MSGIRTRRVVAVVTLCVLLLGLAPTAAHACSCAAVDADEMLSSHQAAFLGRLVDKSGGMFGGNATWTFEVTQWVKGDLGPRVEIEAGSSGASCGFELEPAQEAAVFVHIDGETLRSGLCSTLDADAFRAHLRPQQPVDVPATLLVAASGSSHHLWLFDRRGRLAGAIGDGRGEYLLDISLCPGGRRIVELWEPGKVVVRDLPKRRAVTTLQAPRNLGRVWCRDPRGNDILGARRSNATSDFESVIDVRAANKPLVSGDWVGVEVVGENLIASVGRDNTRLHRVSLDSGRSVLLHTAVSPVGELNVPAGIEGFAISPDQTRVAFEVTNYPANGEPSSDVFIRNIDDRKLVARRHLAVEGAEVTWLDDNAVLFTGYDEKQLVLSAATLAEERTLPAKEGSQVVRLGDGLVGMQGARLLSFSGRPRTLAAIPAEYAGWVLKLPRPLRVRQPRGGPTEAGPVVTPQPTEAAAPGPLSTPSPSAAIVLAALVAVALAAGTAALLRRRGRG